MEVFLVSPALKSNLLNQMNFHLNLSVNCSVKFAKEQVVKQSSVGNTGKRHRKAIIQKSTWEFMLSSFSHPVFFIFYFLYVG